MRRATNVLFLKPCSRQYWSRRRSSSSVRSTVSFRDTVTMLVAICRTNQEIAACLLIIPDSCAGMRRSLVFSICWFSSAGPTKPSVLPLRKAATPWVTRSREGHPGIQYPPAVSPVRRRAPANNNPQGPDPKPGAGTRAGIALPLIMVSRSVEVEWRILDSATECPGGAHGTLQGSRRPGISSPTAPHP